MDENRYWGTLQNWTPKNEEERQDQQRYIRASFEARELDRKEKLSDEDYQRMVAATVDEEQRIQFENDHISQSEYDAKMDELVSIITEIDAKYGIGQERLANERDVEVARKREELLALRAYFVELNERNVESGYEFVDGDRSNVMPGFADIMFEDDYANMNAEELLVEYERIHAAFEKRGDFEELVAQGKEIIDKQIKDEHRRRVRERINRGNGRGGNGGNGNEEKDKIERKIKQFNNGVKTIEEHLNKIKASLILDYSNDLDVTEAIRGVDSELKSLDDEANQLLAELDDFKSKYQDADFSKDGKQILGELKELKDKLKNVKETQVTKYNARVDATNSLIAELKSLTDLSPEAAEMIANLSPLEKCSDITKWDQIGYLRTINNYKDLIETNKLIAEIKTKINGVENYRDVYTDYYEKYMDKIEKDIVSLGDSLEETEFEKFMVIAENINSLRGKLENDKGLIVEDLYNHYLDRINDAQANLIDLSKGMLIPVPSSDKVYTDYFEKDMDAITNEITRIESEIKEGLDNDAINVLAQDMILLSDNISAFIVKLENNKDRIAEDLYNHYLGEINGIEARVNDAQANLADLIHGRGKDDGDEDKSNDYDELMKKLNILQLEVNNLDFMIESLYGLVLEGAVKKLEDQLNTLSTRLEDIEKDIEEKRAEGKLDDNQYNNLKNRVAVIRATIEKAQAKLKDPKMVKDVDVFAFLNGRIDGVEKALDSLEQQIDGLEKPIKDRKTRKSIDAIIKKLEEEIKDIGQQLEKYKEEDPEKYEATKERLNAAKDRLDKISKKYRAKCPLVVRIIKSAKDFYKKHKKLVLIAAGLAAIALIHATVGPILIPAIMHGNIMIGATAPALRGFVTFANNILGGMIGATQNIHGIWSLASGAIINPAVSATSLLKGLAISGIGNTLLITPIIVAIKKLIEKMKKAELKKKLDEDKEKEQDKEKEEEEKKKKEKKKKEKDDSKKKNKRAAKDAMEYIAELCRDYQKSGKSIEEFCEERELSEQEKAVLELYLAHLQENLDKTAASNRGGRK